MKEVTQRSFTWFVIAVVSLLRRNAICGPMSPNQLGRRRGCLKTFRCHLSFTPVSQFTAKLKEHKVTLHRGVTGSHRISYFLSHIEVGREARHYQSPHIERPISKSSSVPLACAAMPQLFHTFLNLGEEEKTGRQGDGMGRANICTI